MQLRAFARIINELKALSFGEGWVRPLLFFEQIKKGNQAEKHSCRKEYDHPYCIHYSKKD